LDLILRDFLLLKHFAGLGLWKELKFVRYLILKRTFLTSYWTAAAILLLLSVLIKIKMQSSIKYLFLLQKKFRKKSIKILQEAIKNLNTSYYHF